MNNQDLLNNESVDTTYSFVRPSKKRITGYNILKNNKNLLTVEIEKSFDEGTQCFYTEEFFGNFTDTIIKKYKISDSFLGEKQESIVSLFNNEFVDNLSLAELVFFNDIFCGDFYERKEFAREVIDNSYEGDLYNLYHYERLNGGGFSDYEIQGLMEYDNREKSLFFKENPDFKNHLEQEFDIKLRQQIKEILLEYKKSFFNYFLPFWIYLYQSDYCIVDNYNEKLPCCDDYFSYYIPYQNIPNNEAQREFIYNTANKVMDKISNFFKFDKCLLTDKGYRNIISDDVYLINTFDEEDYLLDEAEQLNNSYVIRPNFYINNNGIDLSDYDCFSFFDNTFSYEKSVMENAIYHAMLDNLDEEQENREELEKIVAEITDNLSKDFEEMNLLFS